MTAQLMPYFIQKFFDSNGNALAGGKLYSYQAGTSTPLATYTDETAGTPNPNPVILDSSGQASVWVGANAYKFILQDSLGNVIRTVDNVSYINPLSLDNTKINVSGLAGLALAPSGGNALDVQVDNTTVNINGSNQLQVKPGAITADFLPSTSKLEVIYRNTRDLSDPGSIKTIPQYEWSSPTLTANVGTLPASQATACKWSPNGEFLAVGSIASPYIIIYQYSPLTGFTKLADPGTLPIGSVSNISWSPCGDFLAVSNRCPHSTADTPAINIYQRSGNTFTKLADPASLPTASSLSGDTFGQPVLFSPNSDFLLTSWTHTGTKGFILYERSGVTFTDVTTTSTLSGISYPFAWSADSSLLAGKVTATGAIAVYSRKDNVFTAITGPVVTTYLGDITGFSFSPDGNFLAVTVNISPYILLFSASGGVFSQLSQPAVIPGSVPLFPIWSANSEYLGFGVASTPFVFIYKVTNPTTTPVFTKIADPGVVPADFVEDLDWSPTKQFLALTSDATPYIQVYKTASTLPGDSLLWSRGVPNV